MPKPIDITGQQFGRLTAIRSFKKNNQLLWVCRCSCGNEIFYPAGRLRWGDIKSCGCLRTERIIQIGRKNKTHGLSKTRLSRIFDGMRKRCYRPNNKDYMHYGGKGVKIFSEWMKNRAYFYEWAMKNGYDDDLTIDRINPSGNYSPENCRWITLSENSSRAQLARRN